MDFKDKNIAVIGAGVEGMSSAEFLKKNGANVTILDLKDSDDYLNDLDSYDLIVRSPGVHPKLLKDIDQSKIYECIKEKLNVSMGN